MQIINTGKVKPVEWSYSTLPELVLDRVVHLRRSQLIRGAWGEVRFSDQRKLLSADALVNDISLAPIKPWTLGKRNPRYRSQRPCQDTGRYRRQTRRA